MSVLRYPARVLSGPLMTMLWSLSRYRPAPLGRMPQAVWHNPLSCASESDSDEMVPSARACVTSVANRVHPRGRVSLSDI
jgi:hypothetical protein